MSVTAMIENLPSVTVCIPARNETHAMTECLERVVDSAYPKLEIIVLDDKSSDDTSTLIKSFAHEGVRFVQGKPLPKEWLGKNFALQEMAQEASGSILLFMDVDTRIEPDTIEQLVAYMMQEDASMISVLPRRHDGWRQSVLFSTLRYFWELILHRNSSPATASNAWMIRRNVLMDEYNGFENHRQAIQPESRFSKELMGKNKYRFLIGTEELGVSYEKKWRSQVSTSIRLLYPLIGGRLSFALIGIVVMLVLLSPIMLVVQAIVGTWTIEAIVAALFLIAYTILFATYLRRVWSKAWWFGALLWPLIVAQEYLILIVSIERYLRGVVTWKGRPVIARDALLSESKR